MEALKANEVKTAEYVAIVDKYTSLLAPVAVDPVTRSVIRLLVSQMAREVMHWTNNYSSAVAAQVDVMLDQKGL